MIDIIDNPTAWRNEPKYLIRFSFKFDGLEFLRADKYGNFFVLKHCPNKKTVPFKQLVKKRDRIYYHGVAYSMSTLRHRAIKHIETLNYK